MSMKVKQGRNWSEVLDLEHCVVWLTLRHQKTRAGIFGTLRNVMMEENGEDNRVRESN